MSPWKIGGGIAGASLLALGLVAVAHHARAQDDVAAAASPHGTALTEAQMAEHQRQLGALMTVVLAHTDFEAVDAHVAELIRANADQIGGDPEALVVHVHEFLGQVAEHVAADPATAGEHVAHMLIEAHRPQ